MEYRIMFDNKLVGFENMQFAVDLKKLTKEAKNRTYGNLSPCHNAALKQTKHCETCGVEVSNDQVTHKGFKLGKDVYPISAQHLVQIKKNLDTDIIKITEFRSKQEIPDMYISDMIFGVKQHKKYLKEYIEFARVLSATNKVGVGTFVFKERPYPVIVYPFREGLVIRGLFYYNEVEAMPSVTPVMVNETKITLLCQAMGLNNPESEFDISIFVNTRVEEEEKLLEKVIHGQPLPDVARAEPMVAVSADQDEILRLQQLLAQRKSNEIKAEGVITNGKKSS